MKVLLASSPIIGHVNPTLVAARVLENAGHTTAIYTGTLFRQKVESAGIRFFPLPADVDHDMRDMAATFPEILRYPPGLEQLAYGMKAIFVDAIPSQFQGLQEVLREFPADLIVHESGFCGVLPLLLGQRVSRPACAHLGITILQLPREDGAPTVGGVPPAASAAQRDEYRALAGEIDAVVTTAVWKHADEVLNTLDLPALPAPVFESLSTMSDLILQPSVPGFEYPLRESPKTLHFIGALLPEGAGEMPPQVKEAKAAGRKVVLISQGTIANNNLGQLVAPTLQALGDRDDLLLLVTTGGKAIESIPCPLPANTVAAPFLNFREVFPYVDVLVAFGGYGTVTHALSMGVPMVVAGLNEDKPEIAARVVWKGCGIDLRTDDPTAEQLRDAVDHVLATPTYRARAGELAREFATHDTAKELTQLLETLVADQATLVN